MNLYSTLFSGQAVTIKLCISGRSSKDQGNATLITHYVSKIGNESLIFNPSVYLSLENRNDRVSTIVPGPVIYRFAGALQSVYTSLQDPGMFTRDSQGMLYADRRKSAESGLRISTFRGSLTLLPEVAVDGSGKLLKGIMIKSDNTVIGILPHYEVLELMDRLDHFDLSTCTLMAGVLEELEAVNSKTDLILDRLLSIEEKLKPKPAPPPPETGLKWEAV